MKKYFGQWETDKIIESYFVDKTDGFFVEVGAYCGIKGSNSKYFEDIGWKGICIEPIPKVFSKLVKNRKADCFCCAVDMYDGISPLEIFTFKSGIQSSLTSLNTDDRLIEQYGDAISERVKTKVLVTTLENILFPYIQIPDFISIDTEGTELNVLMGLGLANMYLDNKPQLLVVENNYNDLNIEQYLKTRGYRKDQRYYVNDFYIKDKR